MRILLFSLPFCQIQRNFLSLLRHLMTFFVAHPGARTWCHAFSHGGRCVVAILTDCHDRCKQKYLKMIMIMQLPPMESNHRKGHAGHGREGRGNIVFYFFRLASTQQYTRLRGSLSRAAYQSGSSSYVVAVSTFFTSQNRTLSGILSICGSCGLLRLNQARIFSLRLAGASYFTPKNVKVFAFRVFLLFIIFCRFLKGSIIRVLT